MIVLFIAIRKVDRGEGGGRDGHYGRGCGGGVDLDVEPVIYGD